MTCSFDHLPHCLPVRLDVLYLPSTLHSSRLATMALVHLLQELMAQTMSRHPNAVFRDPVLLQYGIEPAAPLVLSVCRGNERALARIGCLGQLFAPARARPSLLGRIEYLTLSRQFAVRMV